MSFPAADVVLPHIETKKALLIVDLQNDFVHRDGKLYVENTADFLPKIPHLVAKFREIGQVIWARTEFLASRPTISQSSGTYVAVLKEYLDERDGVSQHAREIEPETPAQPPQHDPEAFLSQPSASATDDKQCCMPGTTGCQWPSLIEAAIEPEKDILITKSHYSAFEGTPLLLRLRTSLVTDVYICGALSNVSVYATVLDCCRHGLQVTIIDDGVGYRHDDCHVEAMRQMVDGMGANGIDYPELMDDLYGLLGDVIKMDDFTATHHVTFQPSSQKKRTQTASSRPSVEPAVESTVEPTPPPRHVSLPPDLEVKSIATAYRHTSPSQSPQPPLRARSNTHDARDSPPRKRSLAQPEEEEEHRRKVQQKPTRRASEEPTTTKSSRIRSRRKKEYHDAKASTSASSSTSTISTTRPSGHHIKSTGDIPDRLATTPDTPTHPDAHPIESEMHHETSTDMTHLRKLRDKHLPPLGPDSVIGTGDTRIIYTALPLDPFATPAFFAALRTSLPWQTMNHRAGPVPRLVVVQGTVTKNGPNSTVIPIYRHPADCTPPVSPFHPHVFSIKTALEDIVGHELNHVLIQLYRSSEDNISEHADKTLDIVHGSTIVNYSLGAERVMTLRSKKTRHHHHHTASSGAGTGVGAGSLRETQRIPLPHNSLFLLGPTTNRAYLHSIRADKRPSSQKTRAELAFNGERISFTFRQIGTLVDTDQKVIWGQGARAKTRETARPILMGEEGKREWERLIEAFGWENHASPSFSSSSIVAGRGKEGNEEANEEEKEKWSWDECYGRGFDVLDGGEPTLVREVEEKEVEVGIASEPVTRSGSGAGAGTTSIA